jgi:hypothetical protein
MFKNAGENCNTFKLDLSTLNTENAMSFSEFLYRAAFNAKTVELKGFSNLNFDNNPSVSSMMYYFADKAEDIELDMTNIDLSKVTSYYYMFADMLHHGKNVKVDFSGMKLSDQGDVGSMFSYFAGGAKGLHFIMNDVDVENRTSLSSMFNSVARDYSSDVTIEVKNWNVKNIENMSAMFNYIANDCKNYVKIDLSGWNPENLKNTERMFNGVGNYIGEYDNYNGYVEIKGYSNWDMSKVTNASQMFAFIGGYSTTVSLDKITNWEFNNEVNLYYLFNYTGKSATSPIDIGTLNVPAGTTNIAQLFNGARSMKAIVNIYGNPTNYSNAFSDASSTCGGITVNYSNSTTNIDSIIGNNTHVTKGDLLD